MKRLFLYAVLWPCFFSACISDKMVPTIPLHMHQREVILEHIEKKPAVDRLEAFWLQHPEEASYVQDALFILKAQQQEQKGLYKEAADSWWKALEYAEKSFGHLAFEGLLTNLIISHQQNALSEESLYALLQEEAATRKQGNYLKNLLLDQKKLQKKISSLIAKNEKIKQDLQAETIFAPKEKSIPQEDIMLEQTAAAYCNKKQDQDSWKAWERTLPAPLQNYWHGVSSFCQNDRSLDLKIEKCLQGIAVLKDYPEYTVYQLRLEQKLTNLYRQNGMRELLIRTYLSIGDLLLSPYTDHVRLGISLETFRKEKVTDLLWSARYAAMGEAYEQAEAFAIAAKNQIEQITSEKKLGTESDKNLKKPGTELADQLAESYLIRASRIHLEQQAYQKGIDLLETAKTVPDITPSTRHAILWYQGLLSFLKEDWQEAGRLWELLLVELQNKNQEASYGAMRAHFWLAQALKKQDKQKKASEHLDLIQEKDPLGFYAVIAFQHSSIGDQFGSLKQMEEAIAEKQQYKISRLYEDKQLSFWLKKTEILLLTDASPVLARLALKELSSYIKTVSQSFPASERRNTDIYLYLTRLAAMSGDFSKAIVYTGLFAQNNSDFWVNHPEQLRVFFPFAYENHFQKAAESASLPTNVMRSIARQESSFTADAVSPAGATGLMQLMPQTAKRYEQNINGNDQQVANSLKDANLNISIASQYLKTLFARYGSNEPAIYAAYNAGEFAVDQWLKKRHHEDLILWVELIPFGETKEYVQKVWRNRIVYDFLLTSQQLIQ